VSGPQPGPSSEDGASTVEKGTSSVDPVSTTPAVPPVSGDDGDGDDGADTAGDDESSGDVANADEPAAEADTRRGEDSRDAEVDSRERVSPEAARSGPVESSGNVASVVVGLLALAALGVGAYLTTTTGGEDAGQAAGSEAEISLQVESRPEGATVYFDGREVGVTPMELSVPGDETVALELSKQGYGTKRFRNLDPSEQPGDRVFTTLERRIVELKVRSPFPRSEVSVDGESRGVLPGDRSRTFQVEWPTSGLSVTLDPPNHEPLTRRFPASAITETMEIEPAKAQFVPDDSPTESDAKN
jgi:hypothetical protein